MTLSEYQTILHTLYQGDDSTPESTSTDWAVRLNLLKTAIAAWDNEKGVLWNELWTQLADAADGDKTVAASDVDYGCPSDFRFAGTYVRTTDSSGNHTYWTVVKPEKSELFKNEDATICWFTGNKKTGFGLHFGKQPTAGHTINYPYYKEPFEPSSAAHIIEMSAPYFAVYFALAKLHELDGEGDRALLALSQAEAQMQSMRTRNMMAPHYQDNYVPDRDFEIGVPGFGK
jgi:hypothetical protein